MNLRETIAKAIDETARCVDWDGLSDTTNYVECADAVLAAINAGHVVIERDDAAHIYDVLMSTGKTKTARLVFDALAPKP